MSLPTKKLLLALAAALPLCASATDVTVIGLFPGKAVVTIDRGSPKTLSIGERTAEGVMLVSVKGDSAILEIDGKRQTLEMGQHFETAAASTGRSQVTLAPDGRGQYVTDGQINGTHIRFLVDTGATLISMSASDAQRLGIDYRSGQRAMAIVADGRQLPAWRVKLDSVTVGDITIFGVDAMVGETGMGAVLLGMSFLNRTEIRHEGPNLVLTKRY